MEKRPFINTVERLASVTRSARAEAGLTQAELAKRAGVGRKFIVDIEAGHPRAEVGKVMLVLKALDLQPRAVPASTPHAFKSDGTLKKKYVKSG